MSASRIYYEANNKPFARNLRRNATKEERHLWYDFLKSRPYCVRRQKQFGPYIVDFYIASAKLVIELDGSQHYDDEAMEYDRQRTDYLRRQGLTVIRFSNAEVMANFREVCESIERTVTGEEV